MIRFDMVKCEDDKEITFITASQTESKGISLMGGMRYNALFCACLWINDYTSFYSHNKQSVNKHFHFQPISFSIGLNEMNTQYITNKINIISDNIYTQIALKNTQGI